MRLFRRSLLCLVVGVTAFGVAGWGFRPKPNWEVTLGTKRGLQFLFAENEPGEGGEIAFDDPIWLKGNPDEARLFAKLLAYDVGTGQPLGEVSMLADELARVTRGVGGRLVATTFINDDRKVRFKVYDARSGLAPFERTLDGGDWRTNQRGTHAWRVQFEPQGLRFEHVELQSGRRTTKSMKADVRTLSTARTTIALSPDDRSIAVSEIPSMGDKPPSVLVFVLDDESLSTRAPLPPTPRTQGSRIDAIQFVDRHRIAVESTKWSWANLFTASDEDRQRCCFDLETGEWESPDWRPTGISGGTEPIAGTSRGARGLRFWSTVRIEPPEVHFALTSRRTVIHPWRRYPFPIAAVKPNSPIVKSSEVIDAECVPQTDALLVFAIEPPTANEVPELLHSLIPKSWRMYEWRRRIRWHDWRSGVWRDVGCGDDLEDYQVRPGAFVAIHSTTEESALLQSWPLPPRDPKWPALGVAALCVAGTWWLCARRHRRRMNRAAIPPVTA